MTSHLEHSLVEFAALFTAVAAFDISCVERQLNLAQVIRKSLAPYLSLKQSALKMNFMFFPKKWV